VVDRKRTISELLYNVNVRERLALQATNSGVRAPPLSRTAKMSHGCPIYFGAAVRIACT
jgi:hypothetical protein